MSDPVVQVIVCESETAAHVACVSEKGEQDCSSLKLAYEACVKSVEVKIAE